MISREKIIGINQRQPVDGSLPYGRWMILPCLLALFAFSLSVVAAFHCSFFTVHKKFSQVMTGFGFQHTTEGSIQVGIWRTQQDWAYAPLPDNGPWKNAYATTGWETYDEAWIAGSPNCVDWKFSKLGKLPDRPAKFARMVSVFIILIGAPLVVLMITYAAYHPLCMLSFTELEERSELPQRQNWPKISLVHVMTVCCFIEGFLTSILLSVLATDACSEDRVDSCSLSTAGYMSILGAFSWWGSMVSLWLVSHPPAESKSSPNAIDKDDQDSHSNSGLESTDSSEDNNADEEKGESGNVEDKQPDGKETES